MLYFWTTGVKPTEGSGILLKSLQQKGRGYRHKHLCFSSGLDSTQTPACVSNCLKEGIRKPQRFSVAHSGHCLRQACRSFFGTFQCLFLLLSSVSGCPLCLPFQCLQTGFCLIKLHPTVEPLPFWNSLCLQRYG